MSKAKEDHDARKELADLEKRVADEEERQRADAAINRLKDALDKADSNLNTIPQTAAALGDFKQGTIPHLAQLAQDTENVPSDFANPADALRDRLHNLNREIDERISRAADDEAREAAATAIIDDKRRQLDEILAHYQQGPQPLDIAENDAKQLKGLLDDIQNPNNIDPSLLEKSPQLARDVNDLRQKAKEQAGILDQNLDNERAIRDEQQRIANEIENLRAATNDLPHLDAPQALGLAAELANAARQLKSDADNNGEKVHRPSEIVSHTDLNDHLPADVLALQQDIDSMQRNLADKVQYESVAPQLKLITQSLETLPAEPPANINEQQEMLDDLALKKDQVEKHLASIPDTEEGRALAEKSAWDLSRIKDLLKQLQDKLGEKMAALAAFRAARKEAEDQLLAITAESPEDQQDHQELADLRRNEDAIAKMRENIANLNSSELDPEEKREYDDLLARLAQAADILRQRREAAEKARQDAADRAALMEIVAPLQSRLAELIESADRLLDNPEGIPAQYAPLADQLNSEVGRARQLLQTHDPATDPQLQRLNQLIQISDDRIPKLSHFASLWDQFVELRNRIQSNLDIIFNELPPEEETVLMAVPEGRTLLGHLMPLDSTITNLRDDTRHLSELVDQLYPLAQPKQEMQFLSVDVETAKDNYNNVLNRLNVELNCEEELERTLNIPSNELRQYREDVDRGEPTSHDRLSYRRLLDDMIADLKNQRAIVERSEGVRRFIRSETQDRLDALIDEAREKAATAIIDDKRRQLDEILAHYQQGPQPLDIAENDAKQLKGLLDDIQNPNNIDPSLLEKSPQLARDVNDLRQKAKEQAGILDQNLDNERAIRDEQQRIANEIENLRAATNDLPHLDAPQALGLAAELANAARQLKSDADNNGEKVHRPSEIVSHTDLNDHLPADVLALQQGISDISAELVDEQLLTESADHISQEIDVILADLRNNTATRENNTRVESDQIPALRDRLKSLEENSAKSVKTRKHVIPRSHNQTNELSFKLNELNLALQDSKSKIDLINQLGLSGKRLYEKIVTNFKLFELYAIEQELDDMKKMLSHLKEYPEVNMMNDISQKLSLLNSIYNQGPQPINIVEENVNKLERTLSDLQTVDNSVLNRHPLLLNNAEALMQNYRQQIANVKKDIDNERAIRDEQQRIANEIENLRAAINELLHLDAPQALGLAAELANAARQLKSDADNNGEKVHRPSEIVSHTDLNDHLSADVLVLQQDISDISAKFENEQLLTESADHINREIDAMLADLRNNTATRENNAYLEDHQIPALRAQLNSLEDKSAEAAGTRKHVAPGVHRLDDLREKIKELDSALQDAKTEADQNEKEELVLQLRLTLEQLDQKPLAELTPSELNAIEQNLGSLPEENAREISEKINAMRKAKEEHDARIADARNALADLEKRVDELEKARPKKKGKDKEPSIDELREKLRTINDELLPRANELVNEPILSSTPTDDTDKNRASSIADRLNRLADATQQELNGKIADEEERQRADAAINRLKDALDKADSNLNTIPQTAAALGDFKQGTIPHLAQLAQDTENVPSDFANPADALRDRLHKLNTEIDERISRI